MIHGTYDIKIGFLHFIIKNRRQMLLNEVRKRDYS